MANNARNNNGKKSNVLSYFIFGVIAIIVLLLAMLIGLFVWSFTTAVYFGAALAILYGITLFSYNYLKGNNKDSIAGGIFAILLGMLVLLFGGFIEKKNWGDKTIIIDEVGNIRIGYANSVEMDKVDKIDVTEVSEMNVSTIATLNVTEAEEVNISTVKTQNVTEIEEQNVSTIKTQNVTEIEEQNVSTIKTQNVSVIEEQNVSTIKTQNVSVIEEQNVSTIKTQNVTVIEEQNVSTIKTQNTTVPKKTTVKPQETTTTTTAHTCSWRLTDSKPATCTEVGWEKYECSCGNVSKKDIPKKDHNFGSWQYNDNQHWRECSVCRTQQDCASHNWDAGTVTVQPTEYSEGTKTYRCSVCGHSKTESVAKLAPSKPAVVDVEATFGSPNFSYGSTVTVTVRFKNVSSVPSSVVSTSLGRLEVVTQGVNGSDYVIVYNVTGITEANVGSSVFLSLASGYDFISDPVCTITE